MHENSQKLDNYEDLEDKANPWAVSDPSVFLKYCCPECQFVEPDLQYFSDHAVANHPNASTLFSVE